MKYSKQREIVLKALEENVIHPTADELYKLIIKDFPNIGLATVYRNLNLLAEKGVIKKIYGLDDAAHFDHNTHNHHHFICTKCNKIYDIPYDIASDIADNVWKKTGFAIERTELSFQGTCKNCQTKN